MSTHPYLPLYVDDYDAATAHLTAEEDGVYGRLLRLCWRTPGCSLPNEPAWIARKIRLSMADYERVAVPVLTEFFRLQRGRLVQKRLKSEYDDISRKKSARKLAGQKGGQAKARKTHENVAGNATALPAHTRAFPYPEPEEERANALFVASAEPTPTASKEPWDRDPDFGKLWDAAPPLMRKRAKSKAKTWPEWQRATKRSLPGTIVAGLIRYKALDSDLPRSGGPGLHIWLRDRTWEQWTDVDTGAPIGADWPESRWAVAVELWRKDGAWDDRLGPTPGKPGCRVPSQLLIQPMTAGSAA